MIEYAEYQREPTVWDLKKKQKLIDSILRNIDIASIYLYKNEEIKGAYECIDGRQRINAILSFLGLNEDGNDPVGAERIHNYFRFVSDDELFGGSNKLLADFENKTWKDLTITQQNEILDFEFNVVEISDLQAKEDLNLMFLRLQLGTPLNAGEKLRAMKGELRNFVFDEIGNHPYFKFLKIPQRRYSKEITAAQIALNYFSLRKEASFARARFVDIQEYFRRYYTFTKSDRAVADLLKHRLNSAVKSLAKTGVEVKSRAMGVSVFFFFDYLIENSRESDVDSFVKFLKLFLAKLSAEVRKGLNIDPEYRDLLKFQTYITQAAVEKYAFARRQEFLQEYFDHYLEYREIKKTSEGE